MGIAPLTSVLYDDPRTGLRAGVTPMQALVQNPLADGRRYLEREEEQALVRRMTAGDDVARHQLILAHDGLVTMVARRMRQYRRGPIPADVRQEGYLGLCRAADKFDPAKGVRFLTYAYHWVRVSLFDHLLRNRSAACGEATTRAFRAVFFGAGQAMRDGHRGDDLAHALKVSPEQLAQILPRVFGSDVHLDTPMPDGRPFMDALVDGTPSPEDRAAERESADLSKAMIQRGLGRLSPRERRIITARHLSDRRQTLETIGAKMGVSRERIRQIEAKALNKLRAAMGAQSSERTRRVVASRAWRDRPSDAASAHRADGMPASREA
jgi:RNA polymerase sigma-32 factor